MVHYYLLLCPPAWYYSLPTTYYLLPTTYYSLLISPLSLCRSPKNKYFCKLDTYNYLATHFTAMKKMMITIAVCLFSAIPTIAQSTTDHATTPVDTTAATPVVISVETTPATPVQVAKYGYLSYSQVLENMTEYKVAQQQLKELRTKYEMEAQYNESSFRRQFAEFLQGQKDFPQSIMLKRQRDLQEALEKSLAFRDEAERLLKQAETEVLAPIKARLDNAIRMVGGAYNLEYIYNMDTNAMPYVNPALVMDVTKLVEQQLYPVQQ